MNLKDRLSAHAEKLNHQEEMEATLAGVFNVEANVVKEDFKEFVRVVIMPGLKEFKSALREVGRDAVIVESLPNAKNQSVAVILTDRYLKFGAAKTLTLINPKDDFTKNPNTKYYEISRNDCRLNIRQQVDPEMGPIVTEVGYGDLNPIFLENELASFFERAYPAQ